MKQTYILVAVLLIVSLFLGYKLVSYQKEISSLTQLANKKDAQINQLKKERVELLEKADDYNNERVENESKVVTVYRTIEKEVSTCDKQPIGNEFINSLRKISE